MRFVWLSVVVGAVVLAGSGVIFWRSSRPASEIISPVDRDTPKLPADPRSPTNRLEQSWKFVDVADALGVKFAYSRGETGAYWPTETTGGGAAWLDFDNDGRLDLFFVNNCQTLGEANSQSQTSQLYRNCLPDHYVLVIDHALSTGKHYGQGAAVGDYDNDGFDDLLITNYGPNLLYHNNGDGTFSECSAAVGIEGELWSASAAFGDLNRDGALDLYICEYLDFDPETMPVCRLADGRLTYCGPKRFEGVLDSLYLNQGDGTFRVWEQSEAILKPGKGLGVVIADLNKDGAPDIYVANDGEPNFLYRSRTAAGGAELVLEEVAVQDAAAINSGGEPQAGMGVASADYNEDGWPDLAVTNFYLEYLALYQNLGANGFAEVSHGKAIVKPTSSGMGWGVGFVDVDNNGWLDLFATNGYLEQGNPSFPDAMFGTLLRNEQGKRFIDVHIEGGYFDRQWVGRGVAFADYDDDGRLDAAVVHHYQPASVLHNETQPVGGHLSLELVGKTSNRNAFHTQIQALLTSEADSAEVPGTVYRELCGGGSYLSAHDRRVHIGLGDRPQIQELTVRWSSGVTSRLQAIRAGSRLLLVEVLSTTQ